MIQETITHGEGIRCSSFKTHENLKVSGRAICFECQHFSQEIGEDGECPWTLNFDDRGACAIGKTNS